MKTETSVNQTYDILPALNKQKQHSEIQFILLVIRYDLCVMVDYFNVFSSESQYLLEAIHFK